MSPFIMQFIDHVICIIANVSYRWHADDSVISSERMRKHVVVFHVFTINCIVRKSECTNLGGRETLEVIYVILRCEWNWTPP